MRPRPSCLARLRRRAGQRERCAARSRLRRGLHPSTSGDRRPSAPPSGRDHAWSARDDVRGLGGARDPGTEPRGARHRADADRAGLHNPVGAGDLPRGAFPAGRLARPPRSFFFGELSAGLIFAGGLGLLVHALGGAYLVAAGVILGVLSAMLAIWTLFVGLGLEQREG
jgi:hypothetical protein